MGSNLLIDNYEYENFEPGAELDLLNSQIFERICFNFRNCISVHKKNFQLREIVNRRNWNLSQVVIFWKTLDAIILIFYRLDSDIEGF